MTTKTRSPWASILVMGGAVAAAGVLIFGVMPGFRTDPGGRTQSKVYELVVNYQNIPGGVRVRYTRAETGGVASAGLLLRDRSGSLTPPVYLASRGPVTLEAIPNRPSEGGTAVGQYQLIVTITLYQHGQIVNVWEDSASVRNQSAKVDTANPPTG